MHDNHEPDCAFCTKFKLPFHKDSPLAEWGFCGEDMKGRQPSEEELKEIEEEVRKGDYSFLNRNDLVLYQAVGEGCEKFETFEHHS
jgi:hypothetical protein